MAGAELAMTQVSSYPAHAGIQYAAAPRFHQQCLWNTGSSAGACHPAGRRPDRGADDDGGEYDALVLNPSLRANGSRECAALPVIAGQRVAKRRPMTGFTKPSIAPRKERITSAAFLSSRRSRARPPARG